MTLSIISEIEVFINKFDKYLTNTFSSSTALAEADINTSIASQKNAMVNTLTTYAKNKTQIALQNSLNQVAINLSSGSTKDTNSITNKSSNKFSVALAKKAGYNVFKDKNYASGYVLKTGGGYYTIYGNPIKGTPSNIGIKL